jgi:ferredoxin
MIPGTIPNSWQRTNEPIRTKVALELPPYLLREPVLCNLAKRYELVFNILGADFEDGRACFILELEGKPSDRESALRFLSDIGVRVQPVKETISVDKAKCTECGACIGICPANCFSRDPDTWETRLDDLSCIACGECARVCPPRAISPKFVLAATGRGSGVSSIPPSSALRRQDLGRGGLPRKRGSPSAACERHDGPHLPGAGALWQAAQEVDSRRS